LLTPVDLERWFAESELALPDLSVSADTLQSSLRLRDAIWRSANALAHGKQPDSIDLTSINQAALREPLAPQIDPATRIRSWHHPAPLNAALATIAHDAIDLFTGSYVDRIRECANPRCILLFVDTSRPGKRRWCSMDACGNIAKTRRYRRQRKQDVA
jgi:predicted RNA-binding Zn ribbon-like protein